MKESPYLLRFNEEDTSKKVPAEEILRGLFTEEDLNNLLMCMDFDNTMVIDDAGIQVFLQTLRMPGFWRDKPDEFKRLLLPSKYKELLKLGERNKEKDLNPEKCQLSLELAHDISALYREIRKLSPGQNMKAGDDPMILEFALKMIMFDEVMMRMDSVFSRKLGGDFLLRTRFFRHRTLNEIKTIAEQICRQMGDFVNLEISPGNRIDGVDKLITQDHPAAQARRIRTRPRIDTRVLTIAKTILSPDQGLAIPRVITTNHPAIPRTIIRNSEWAETIDQQERFRLSDRLPLVRGTRLQMHPKNNGHLRARPEELPVNGKQKAILAEQIAQNLRRRFRIAIGDSLGDLSMGVQAVRNNGIFMIVSQEAQSPIESIEALRRRFREKLRDRELEDSPRVMIITPKDL